MTYIKTKIPDIKKKILSLIRVAIRPLRRFHIYEIYCTDVTISEYEEPKCPSEWHNSGCYNREIYNLNAFAYLVTARDKDEADSIRIDYLEEERECIITSPKYSNPASKGLFCIYNDLDEIGYSAEPVLIRRSVKPMYKDYNKKDVLIEFHEKDIISSERRKYLEQLKPIDLINIFRRQMDKWKTKQIEIHSKKHSITYED